MILSVKSVVETALAYRIYGVMLRVNMPLLMLSGIELVSEQAQRAFSLEAISTIQVNIRETEQALHIAPPGADDAVRYVQGSAWRMDVRSPGTAYVLQLRQETEALWVEVSPTGSEIEIRYWGMPLAEVTALLVGCVLGVAMRLQGLMCLHSSVVNVDGEAISLIGEKGAGKSTTAAAMAQMGYSVLTDDIAVINLVEGRFYVHPGYPSLRLWNTAVQALRGSTKGLAQVFRSIEKHLVELGVEDGWRFEKTALPLKAIYLLGERDREKVRPSWTAVSRVEGLRGLMMNQYPQWLRLEELRQRQEIAVLAQLIQEVPVRRVKRSDDLSSVEDVGKALSEKKGIL